MITVDCVSGRKMLRDFVKVPKLLYKNEPYFVSQLDSERFDHLSGGNPYFNHALHQLFLAYDSGRPVGRISAQIDELAKGAHFGFLDAANEDVLGHLLTAAEQWLRSHGKRKVSGPYSLSINDEAGLLVDGFDSPPCLMMNFAPRWLASALERYGYTKVKDLFAFYMSATQDIPAPASRLAKKALSLPGLTVRQLNRRHMAKDLEIILDIFNAAWAGNWGFVTMTRDEISYTVENMGQLIDPALVYIAEVENVPVSMIVALPDLNEAIAGFGGKLLPFNWAKLIWRLKIKGLRGARVLLMGALPEFQGGFNGSAIATLLIFKLHEALRLGGYDGAELSWVLEDNVPVKRLVEAVGGQRYKTYRIYEKDLA